MYARRRDVTTTIAVGRTRRRSGNNRSQTSVSEGESCRSESSVLLLYAGACVREMIVSSLHERQAAAEDAARTGPQNTEMFRFLMPSLYNVGTCIFAVFYPEKDTQKKVTSTIAAHIHKVSLQQQQDDNLSRTDKRGARRATFGRFKRNPGFGRTCTAGGRHNKNTSGSTPSLTLRLQIRLGWSGRRTSRKEHALSA